MVSELPMSSPGGAAYIRTVEYFHGCGDCRLAMDRGFLVTRQRPWKDSEHTPTIGSLSIEVTYDSWLSTRTPKLAWFWISTKSKTSWPCRSARSVDTLTSAPKIGLWLKLSQRAVDPIRPWRISRIWAVQYKFWFGCLCLGHSQGVPIH